MSQAPSSAPTNWNDVGGGIGTIARNVFDIFKTSKGQNSSGPGWLNQQVIKESTEELRGQEKEYYDKIQDTFVRLGGLTGVSTPDAVQDYYNRFSDFMDKAYAQGRTDLEADYALGDQYYNRLEDTIDRSQAYSLLRNPVYEAAYKAPDAVAPVNVDAIKNVMTLDASDPEQFKKFSYSQPESQALIKGRPDAISEYANFFASKPTQDLMKYTV